MTKEINKKKNWFVILLLLITVTGGIIRFVNINYTSLWSDELYSALLANPKNSWYEILYIQRALQPPLYALSLWVWVKIFAYNEFWIRLYTLIAGTACIAVSGYLGKKIHSSFLGILLAVIVAFNPTQIWFSLEARFYAFVYLFAAISLLLYWQLRFQEKSKSSNWLFFIKVIIDATLCYFHHFGIVFLFAMFLFDIALFIQRKNKMLFLKWIGGYALSALLYLPWVLWAWPEAFKVKHYWLTETNVKEYLLFNFSYPMPITLLCIFFIILFFLFAINNKRYFLLPLICLVVTVIPVMYSYIRLPILESRFAMVMAPAVYAMIGIGCISFLSYISKSYWPMYKPSAIIPILLLLFIAPGLYLSFINRDGLIKQPWREMGKWLRSQPDIDSVKVYSTGSYVKNKIDIDFYLAPGHSSTSVTELKPGTDKKMYLVETNGAWKIPDSTLNTLHRSYNISEVKFNAGLVKFGDIYICTLKK